MYGEYGRLIRGNMRFQGTGELTVSYALQAPEYRLLRERYPDAGWGIEAPLQKALFMLSWVHRQVRHAGDYDNADPQDALTLLAVGARPEKGAELPGDVGYPGRMPAGRRDKGPGDVHDAAG